MRDQNHAQQYSWHRAVLLRLSQPLKRMCAACIKGSPSLLESDFLTPHSLLPGNKNSRRALGCSVLLSPLSHLQKLDQELLHDRFVRARVPKTHLPGCHVAATILPFPSFLIT
jgi:hypothetical protein